MQSPPFPRYLVPPRSKYPYDTTGLISVLYIASSMHIQILGLFLHLNFPTCRQDEKWEDGVQRAVLYLRYKRRVSSETLCLFVCLFVCILNASKENPLLKAPCLGKFYPVVWANKNGCTLLKRNSNTCIYFKKVEFGVLYVYWVIRCTVCLLGNSVYCMFTE